MAISTSATIAISVNDIEKTDRPSQSPASETLVRFCLAVIGILFLAATIQTLLTPQRFWDERAIYGIKAKVLFEDSTINSPDLLNPDFVQYHPRYPLLLPLAEQHIYSLLGSAEDRWSKIVCPLLSLGLVLTFAGVVSRHIRPEQAWLFATMLATAPVLMPYEYGFLSAQADAPVAVFHGVSLLYLWDWLQGGTGTVGPVMVAGLASGLTLFTKDEGIALLLVDFTTFAVIVEVRTLWFDFCRKNSLRTSSVEARGNSSTNQQEELKTRPISAGPDISTRASQVAIVLLGEVAALLAVPWFWHRSFLPTTTEMSYFNRLHSHQLEAGLRTLKWSVPHLLSRMFSEAREWGLQWWLMLIAGITVPTRAIRSWQILLMMDVLGAIAGLLVAGMIAPTPVQEHLGGSSHRFLMQLVPVALLFAAGQWGDPRQLSDGQNQLRRSL